MIAVIPIKRIREYFYAKLARQKKYSEELRASWLLTASIHQKLVAGDDFANQRIFNLLFTAASFTGSDSVYFHLFFGDYCFAKVETGNDFLKAAQKLINEYVQEHPEALKALPEETCQKHWWLKIKSK